MEHNKKMSKLYKCTCCNKMKQPFEFHKRLDRAKGITSKCKLCISLDSKKYYENNVEIILEKKSDYRETNRDQININQNLNRLNNLEVFQERDRNYYKKYVSINPEYPSNKTAKRRCFKADRTPVWLSKDDSSKIRSIYKMCKLISKKTGVEHHVDHIVPLINNQVSGLHVPWNLQIITKEQNLKKSNKLIEDIVLSW